MTFPDVLELPIAHTTYNIMITFLVILFCLFFCVSFINPKGTSIRKNAAKLIVRKIYVYPIKSCLGISLSSAEVTKLGLKLDRSWCILNRNHKFISQRDEPALGFIKLRVEADMLVVSAPGMQQDLRLPIASTEAEPTDKERIIDTSVWGNDFRCQLLDEKYSMWFREYLNLPAEDPNSDCVLAALLPPAEHDRVLGSYDTSDHKISTGTPTRAMTKEWTYAGRTLLNVE